MNAEELKAAFAEDESFRVGGKVKLYWTSSGRYYKGVGTVTKLNTKSICAILDHEIGSPSQPFGHYPKGRTITVPRIDDIRRWTANNCARTHNENTGHNEVAKA